jgi:hypothetical protein
VLLVLVGLIFLLNNLGLLPWSIWQALAQLWPALLVVLGLDLVFGRGHRRLGAAIALGMLLVVLGTASWLTWRDAAASQVDGPVRPSAPTAGSVTIPLDHRSPGSVLLRVPAGQLRVGSLPADSPDLVTATDSLPAGMTLTQQTTPRDGETAVTLAVSGPTAFPRTNALEHLAFPPPPAATVTAATQVTALLSPRVPLDLTAEVGAGQSSLDLRQLQIRQLTVTSGAGTTTVDFPDGPGTLTADLRGGVGQLVLVIPPDEGVSIQDTGGFSTLHLPSGRFQPVAGGYQTANYATATHRLDLSLHLGVGTVDVR